MHSGNNIATMNSSMTVGLRTIVALLFFLAWVDANSHQGLGTVKQMDLLPPDGTVAESSCPAPDSINNCTCTVVADELFLNCSAVASEEDLALVFQQDFPVKNFTQFDLNRNPNISFLGAIFNGISFERIYLDFNENLELITDEFMLDSLDTLQLLQIRFSNLHRGTFPFSMLQFFNKLETLIIANSESLTSIPKLTSDSLREISFHGSSISDLEPGTFDGVPHLSEVSLDSNKLTSLGPESFRLTASLGVIYLFENSITTIEPGAFVRADDDGPHARLVIDMAPNLLTELRTGTFLLVDGPTSLLLYGNNISIIRPGAFVLPSTTANFSLTLSLENNQLTTLDEPVFGNIFPYLLSFIVYGNPLECGCDLAWIVLNSAFMDRVDSLATCADGVNLHNLDPDDFEKFCRSGASLEDRTDLLLSHRRKNI